MWSPIRAFGVVAGAKDVRVVWVRFTMWAICGVLVDEDGFPLGGWHQVFGKVMRPSIVVHGHHAPMLEANGWFG